MLHVEPQAAGNPVPPIHREHFVSEHHFSVTQKRQEKYQARIARNFL
jgi:hypothetical protein